MTAPRVACLHHLAQPFLGLAEAPLRAAGLELDERNVSGGDPLPDLDGLAGIVSFGGAQSAVGPDDALVPEIDLLRAAVGAELPVLGICLGGQLLARALGAEVRRAPKRTVAWHELAPLAPDDPLFTRPGPRPALERGRVRPPAGGRRGARPAL